MISQRLLAIVLVAFLIVCFISAPVLCSGGDEDPWDVDAAGQGGAGGVGNPGDYPDSMIVEENVDEYGGSGDSDPDGDLFQTIITRYGYGAWVMLMSWIDEFTVSGQAVAGKADGGSVSVK